MIIKNKRTRESLKLTLPEFKKQFAQELNQAFESFKQLQGYRIYYKMTCDKDLESDFYFDLKYNFNNLSNSVWYIERI